MSHYSKEREADAQAKYTIKVPTKLGNQPMPLFTRVVDERIKQLKETIRLQRECLDELVLSAELITTPREYRGRGKWSGGDPLYYKIPINSLLTTRTKMDNIK